MMISFFALETILPSSPTMMRLSVSAVSGLSLINLADPDVILEGRDESLLLHDWG